MKVIQSLGSHLLDSMNMIVFGESSFGFHERDSL